MALDPEPGVDLHGTAEAYGYSYDPEVSAYANTPYARMRRRWEREECSFEVLAPRSFPPPVIPTAAELTHADAVLGYFAGKPTAPAKAAAR